jgi:hypothetical protein
MKKILMIALLLFLICGCKTSKPEFNFPQDIKWICHDAKNQAKSNIVSKGVPLKEKKGCVVVKIKGTKKFGPMWAYYSEEWKQYIGGICGGNYIEIACDPNTGEVNFMVLVHEFGHYWLMTNYNDWSHDPKYKDVFYNWFEPRYLTKSFNKDGTVELIIPKEVKYGEIFSILHIDKNGNPIHIDFINTTEE